MVIVPYSQLTCLCENLKKIRVGFWTPNEKDQFWSSQARGEFAPYGGPLELGAK